MSGIIIEPEIEAYYSKSFGGVVLELHKLAVGERSRAMSTISQIGSGPGNLSAADKRDLMDEIKSTQNARVAFIRIYEQGESGALHALWKDLDFDRALGRTLRSGKRKLDVEALARAMVFNRLCNLTSKPDCLRWLDTVAMPAMPETVSPTSICCAPWMR